MVTEDRGWSIGFSGEKGAVSGSIGYNCYHEVNCDCIEYKKTGDMVIEDWTCACYGTFTTPVWCRWGLSGVKQCHGTTVKTRFLRCPDTFDDKFSGSWMGG